MSPARRPAATAAVALAAALTLPAPAGAVPYAGVSRAADATFRFRAASGAQWQLGLEVAYAVAGTDVESRYLLVRLTQCDARHRCTYSRLWQQPLAVTELTPTPDGGSVTLTTTLIGRAVTATWQTTGGEGSTVLIVPGSAHVESVDHYTATAEATFSGVTCTDGEATARQRVDANATGSPFSGGPKPPAAWPRGFGTKLRCD